MIKSYHMKKMPIFESMQQVQKFENLPFRKWPSGGFGKSLVPSLRFSFSRNSMQNARLLRSIHSGTLTFALLRIFVHWGSQGSFSQYPQCPSSVIIRSATYCLICFLLEQFPICQVLLLSRVGKHCGFWAVWHNLHTAASFSKWALSGLRDYPFAMTQLTAPWE